MTVPITVVNHTGVDIYGFYASVVSTDEWEEDVLGDNILYDGESLKINFTFTLEQMMWDFQIRDIDGNTRSFYDVDFSDFSMDGVVLTLNPDGTASLD